MGSGQDATVTYTTVLESRRTWSRRSSSSTTETEKGRLAAGADQRRSPTRIAQPTTDGFGGFRMAGEDL